MVAHFVTKDKMFKLALIQLKVTANKQQNLENAFRKVMEASKHGAQVAVLPECFNSPYGTKYFGEYAEVLDPITSESMKALSQMAKQANVVLIGGSIPERDPLANKLYNTSTIWNQQGEILGKYRKIHLFDIDVKGKITFQESKTLSAGNSMVHCSTPFGKLAVGVCYDMRFPELAMIAARKGCVAMIYPGAFNMTTGPLHVIHFFSSYTWIVNFFNSFILF